MGVNIIAIISLVILFLILSKSADLIVLNLKKIGKKLGVKIFFLGIMLGIITSLPELAIGVNSLIKDVPDISFGHLMGGNIVLLGLILSISIILNRKIKTNDSSKPFLFTLIYLFLPLIFGLSGQLNIFNGIILILGYVFLMYYLYSDNKKREWIKISVVSQDRTSKNIFYIMKTEKIIASTISKFLNENVGNELNIVDEYVNDLKSELSKFKTDEELLRGGGISIETLDRLAHGFSEEDMKTINPNKLMIKWKDDLENVKYEIKQSGLTPKQWASKINLNEPIDVSYWGDDKYKKGFYIEDGHHRYVAAKILNKLLNVNLEIKVNPIKVIAPNMGYDEFHRYIFNLYR